MTNDEGRIRFGMGLDNDKLRIDAGESKNIIHSIANSAEKDGANIEATFRKVGGAIAAAFTAQQALTFAKSVIDVRKEIESLEISFRTLLGSKEKADQLFGQIRQFAVSTPMQLKDLASGAQTLLSFNYEADKVMGTLKALGDISMGDSQKFNSLTLAFAQMNATGKLMAQDLNQMITQGFNPLAVISEKTGKTIGELRKEMEDGAISAQMVEDAFKAATAQGGKFHGMLEAQSKSIGGAISNLQGAIDDMLNDIGESAQGAFTDAVQVLTDMTKHYKAIGEAIAVLVGIYGTYKAAVIATTVVTRALEMAEVQKNLASKEGIAISTMQALKYVFQANAANMATAATAKLNATILANPYALAAAAVVALGYGIYKLITYETDAEKAAKKLDEATKDLNASVTSERVKIDSLFSRLKAAKKGTEEYESAKQAIIGQYGQYLQGLSKEIQSLEDLEGAYKAVAAAAEQAAKERAMESFTKSAADTYAQTESDEKEKLYKFLQKQYGDKKTKSGRSQAEDIYWQLVGSIDGNGTSVREDWLKKFDKTHYVAGSPTLGGMGGYTYTTNEVRDILNKINRAKGIYDTSMQEAERRFGAAPEKKAEEPAKEPTHNKKYWEDKVKELQGELDAMTDVQLKTDEAAKKRKEIAEAQAKVDAYSVSKTNKAGEKAEKDEARDAVQAAARTEKLNQYDQKQIVAAREFALAVRQAEIDGDKEGLEKQLKQNKLNYDRLMEQNQQRREEFLETLRDMEELRWENANPDAKEKGKTFDRSSVSASLLTKNDEGAYADISGLPEEQQKIINQMRQQLEGYARFAGEEYDRANKESLKSMLEDVQTYEQQRSKITEEYARKREAMYEHDDKGNRTGLREGVQQGNVDELDRNETEALKALDETFAARQDEYEAWCNTLGDLAIKEIKQKLEEAKEELKKMEQEGKGGQQMATARAKVNKLQSMVDKSNAQNELAPKKRTIKEWEDLYRTLDTCANSFKEIGEAVGGTAGKFIKAAGEIASSTISMISGITQLANNSGTAMQATSQAAAASISTVEKASVILTVISAALQVATAIANLFNDDESKQKEIEHLQGRIDQLQWEMDNQDIMRYTSVEESLQRVRSAVKATEDAIIEANGWTNKWYGSWLAHSIAVNNEEALAKSAKELAKAYASVEYSANKALGSAKYDEAKSQLESIGKQQILINEQIAKEKDKKDTDNGKIQEWENQIAELGNKAVEIINGLVEDIIGGSSTDIANELADAFFEAFEAGEDAAKAWGDKVNEIVADIIKKMLIQQYLEEPLGKIFDTYKDKWFSEDGTFLGFDAVKNSMDGFAADLKEKGEEFAIIWEGVGENLKQYFNPDGKFQQDGSTGGFQAMSQDTGDELNGRFTAIQINSEAIKESAISMRGSLEELRNISLLSMGFLEDIEKNTRELYEMNERLDKIAKNTQNL